jgi:hypothetical protein
MYICISIYIWISSKFREHSNQQVGRASSRHGLIQILLQTNMTSNIFNVKFFGEGNKPRSTVVLQQIKQA